MATSGTKKLDFESEPTGNDVPIEVMPSSVASAIPGGRSAIFFIQSSGNTVLYSDS